MLNVLNFGENQLDFLTADECGGGGDEPPPPPDELHNLSGRLIGDLFVTPDTLIEKLNSEYWAAFNPLKSHSVVLLDKKQHAFLNRYTDPPPSLNETTPYQKDDLSMIEQFYSAGLISPRDEDFDLRPTQKQTTLSVWLHITNKCNLDCGYCYINKSSKSMTDTTGKAAIDATIRSAQKNGFNKIHLKFAGGEATLCFGLIFNLFDYALSSATAFNLAVDAVVLSNGVAISEANINKLGSRGIRIMISLDGIKETHDRQRPLVNGQGSFLNIEKNIEKLLSSGIKPFISVTVTRNNVDNLQKLVQYLLKKELAFNLNLYREQHLALDRISWRAEEDILIRRISDALEEIQNNLPNFNLLSCLMDRSDLSRLHNKTCGVGDSYFVVDQIGRVAKCQMEIENPVSDVYDDDPLFQVHTAKTGVQNVPVISKNECNKCIWRYRCSGGCPVMTYRATGRYDIKSPYCNVYKAVFPKLVRLEGLRLLKAHTKQLTL